MSDAASPAPFRILSRHFFHTFFRLSFLDDAGEESFKRATIGVLAFIMTSGLLLARLYIGKYAGVRSLDIYRMLLAADQLFMIALTMFALALIMTLVSQSLIPDELDFRILLALPVSRRTVFLAKLSALLVFSSLFVIGTNVAIGAPFSLVSTSRWSEQSLAMRTAVQLGVGTLASVFAATFVIAIQGLVVALTPRMWLRQVSIVTQTMLIGVLVLSIPLILRAPAAGRLLSEHSRLLSVLPPVWFVGLQQWILGARDAYSSTLAVAAVIGMLIVSGIAAVCYVLLYRRFDQVMLRTADAKRPWRWNVRMAWPFRREPAYDAISGFLSATLRRSGLHQLVFVGFSSAGVALMMSNLLTSSASPQRFWLSATREAPLTLMVATIIGLRAALLLPTNLRAAWVFKMLEADDTRPRQLNAMRHTLFGLGVGGPAILAFLLHTAVLGPVRAAASTSVVLLLGWVFVEIVLNDWRRIPFTCTMLMAKRPAAHTLLLALLAFGVFVSIGGGLEGVATSGVGPWMIVVAVLAGVGALLRWYRLLTWGRLPLEFEDYLPDTIEPLGLVDR